MKQITTVVSSACMLLLTGVALLPRGAGSVITENQHIVPENDRGAECQK
jgi:hypothetical protein